jgi:tetratricopeptide (TPR) repeat protein
MAKPLLVIALLAGLVACAYRGVQHNGFVYDDVYIIEDDHRISDPDGILEIWRTEYWNRPEFKSRLYRPLTLTTFAIERRFLGAEPGHFHVVNAGLHLAVACLFAALCFQWLGDRFGPLPRLLGTATAAGLFAASPVHSEAVLGVVGRSELLAGLFALAALWGLPRGPAGWILSAFAAAGAVLSKESGFLVLPLAVLWVLVGQPGTAGPTRPLGARSAWPPLAVLLGMAPALWLRSRALAAVPIPAIDFGDNPFISAGAWERIVNASYLFWRYLALHVRPDHLSLDHSYAATRVEPWHSPALLASFLVLAGLLAFALARLGARVRARSAAAPDLIAFGLLWYLGGMIAAGNFLLVIGTVFAERLTYLPGMGLFFLVGYGAAALSGRARSRLRVGAIAALAAVGIGVGLLATQARTRAWSSPLALFEDAVRAQPASFRTWAMYGTALSAAGRNDEALRALSRSLAIYDRFPQTWSDQTAILYNSGQYELAAESARRLRELVPNHAFGYIAIAEQALRAGDPVLADTESAAGETAHPGIAQISEVRGRVLAAAGRHRDAAAAFERSLALLPGNLPALRGRASAWLALEAWPEAARALRELYAAEPNWEAANAFAWSLLRVGALDEALEISEVAVSKAPEQLRHDALDTRAEILWSLGREAEAIEIWRELVRDHPKEYADKAGRLSKRASQRTGRASRPDGG